MEAMEEKEILGDALSTQKHCTDNYNTFSNECVNEDLRQTMLDILNEEHNMQQDVFNTMHDKGYYPTPEADQQKIEQAKQKFASACC